MDSSTGIPHKYYHVGTEDTEFEMEITRRGEERIQTEQCHLLPKLRQGTSGLPLVIEL